MTEYLHANIKSIMEGMNKKYFLPDIQRPFVWKPEQIEKLFDSLMRYYPINTFLFWQIDREVIKKYDIKKLKFIINSDEEKSEDTSLDKDEYFLVLDGQQRLTALNIALRGKYIIRNKRNELFFDLLSGDQEQDDGILYNFLFKNDTLPDIDYVKEIKEKDGTIIPTALWIRVKAIYEAITPQGYYTRKTTLMKEIKERFSDLSDKNLEKIEQNIDKLCNVLGYAMNITYFPEKETDYDRVLDIFIRTNAGGTPLSYSDLLFSKIKLKWSEASERFTDLIRTINRNEFDFDEDFLLKSYLVLFSRDSVGVKFKIENFKDEFIDKIRENWDKLARSHKLTVDLLLKYNISNSRLLPSNNAIIPIFYFIYINDIRRIGDYKEKGVSEEEIEQIRLWLIRVLLSKAFGGQSDTLLYKIKKAIDESKRFDTEVINKSIRQTGKNLTFNDDFLQKIRYNSSDSYLFLSLLYGVLNFSARLDSNLPQQDHIFSQAELRGKYPTNEINSIFNIRYVSADENNWKKDTPFQNFISLLSPQQKKMHLIPDGSWNVHNFKDFLKARKELILKILYDKLGEENGSNPEEEDDFEVSESTEELYKGIEKNILAVGNDITPIPRKQYTAFKKGNNNFVTIKKQRQQLKIWVSLPEEEAENFKEILHYTEKGHHGTGNLEGYITVTEQINKFLPAIKLAYDLSSQDMQKWTLEYHFNKADDPKTLERIKELIEEVHKLFPNVDEHYSKLHIKFRKTTDFCLIYPQRSQFWLDLKMDKKTVLDSTLDIRDHADTTWTRIRVKNDVDLQRLIPWIKEAFDRN